MALNYIRRKILFVALLNTRSTNLKYMRTAVTAWAKIIYETNSYIAWGTV